VAPSRWVLGGARTYKQYSSQRGLSGALHNLLADKIALNDKVVGLTETLKTVETARETRLRAARERAAVDTKRAQDAWAAGEKSRRDTLVRKLEKGSYSGHSESAGACGAAHP
jgi:hypothetical protein